MYGMKILSLLLVPVMVISLSGLKMHFHYCSSEGRLFTHFHSATSDNPGFQCCNSNNIHESCCADDHVSDNHSCCLDIISRIITDKDYTGKYNHFTYYPILLQLGMTYLPVPNFHSVLLSVRTGVPDYPKLVSCVVLRCWFFTVYKCDVTGADGLIRNTPVKSQRGHHFLFI